MADNVAITAGAGTTIAADELTDATLGSCKVQYVKLMDGTLDGTTKAAVGANGLAVDVKVLPALSAGANAIGKLAANSGVDIGDVDILSVTPGTAAANLGKAEDAAHASGDVGVMDLTVRQDTATALAGTSGDYQPFITNAAGRLYTSTTVDAALPAGANNIGDVDVVTLPALPAGDNNIGNVDVVTLPALPAGSNNIGDVDIASAPTGASAQQVQGTVAHDAAAANNPILNGAKAVNAEPAVVANADVAMLLTDLVGKLITLPYANPENFVSGATSDITNTTATSVIAAQGAGVRSYITQILVTNSHATVGTFVNITDGSGGTILYTGYAAAAGGGFSVTLPAPIKTTANTALYCACVTGANVRVCASGYKGA